MVPVLTIKRTVYKLKSSDLMEKIICSTCKTHVMARDNFVQFDCPECGEERIVRCRSCKNISNRYVCSKCGFSGP